MPISHPGLTARRWTNPVGKRAMTFFYGRVAVTLNTPVNITAAQHGLKVIENVQVTHEGAIPAATGYEISGTTVAVESAASGTVSYLIVGY